MKKIGYTVSHIAPTAGCSRIGEGSFIECADGSVLYAYSRFGEGSQDDSNSDIYCMRSCDLGESWSDPFVLFRQSNDSVNYMCISFLRMQNGDIGLFYLRKYKIDEQSDVCNEVRLVRSSDEGKTWSDSVVCTEGAECYVFENDHAVMLRHGEYKGRILLPINLHSKTENGIVKFDIKGKMCFFASDDDGHTWYKLSENYEINSPDSQMGLQETCVYEREDGSLRALSRTDMHCQYECCSCDGGKTWSENYPQPYFSSPLSPLLMKRAAGLTLAVFNPIPNYLGRYETINPWSGRTPFVISVSEKDGRSFERVYTIADDPDMNYCYPSVYDGGDYILVGYYMYKRNAPLGANVITKILKPQLFS